MSQFYADRKLESNSLSVSKKRVCRFFQINFIAGLLFLLASTNGWSQLGVFEFTGSGACPHQNPAVTTQPSNAVFSSLSTVNATCNASTDDYEFSDWNENSTIDLNEYHQFTITADASYALNLTTLSFTQRVSENGSGSGSGLTAWILRSSLNNYATNIATGSSDDSYQTPVITLPAGSFTSISGVTFRLYLINVKEAQTTWMFDDVTLNGSMVAIPADPGNPTSDAPQCVNPGVTLTANSSAPAGETWYWQTSATGTSTANSASTWVVTTSGTYYIRSQDNTTLAWSAGAGSITITVTPNVSVPVFTLGASSTRCQAAGAVTYSATAANSTGITYSLDATSTAAGNTIDGLTGEVTYVAGWTGTSTITADAAGCNGPASATHTVTTNATVGTPVFTLGASSTRCQGAGTITYSATAANTTGITYSLDAASLAAGNTINSSTGAVTYTAGWSGTSTITATAAGCGGPTTATHTVTINASVGTPVFTLGASSTRCQGAATISYTATAANTTGITYSLDAASIAGGNTINTATGDVVYVAGWSGTSTITASAAGCNGPRNASHTVTTTPSVGTPVFTLGATSSRCQGGGNVTYGASATNTTGITYSLDAGSIAGGLSINASTGQVTYIGGWSGTTIITATAAGCNGPRTATHTVTVNPNVASPVFALGASSTRCSGGSTITYTATATGQTGMSYSIDLVSSLAGCTINSATGAVTYPALYLGGTTITATATGCNGPRSASHTVSLTSNVGAVNFVMGSNSTRCRAAGTVTYTANAANTTGITYSLDAASIAGGNSINSSTGAVTYAATWSGTTTITASAAGCNGPTTATHTVNVVDLVTTPVFTLGANSTRCQGAGNVTYTATASNTTGITYSLNGVALAGGNTINATTGVVTYAPAWTGVTIITASAAGCSGPLSATHNVTITPTVGTPVFTLGASSTRCQGVATVTYTATATNTTGITYSLDATSLAAGNTINSATGAVTYTGAWTGTSTITASAAGCNGPRTSTHTVTNTASVGTPVFALGTVSTRLQGAGTVTYSATATTTTGITYSLDAASLAAGNTINPATGAVTYTAAWSGATTITATAAGCNGPTVSTHVVSINSTFVTKQLYLSDPSQALDRVDPVNTADATTASTTILSTSGTTVATFTMNPALCSDLTIKAGTIVITNYVTVSTGTMPANPAITAVLQYGATNIITIANPVYSAGIVTWTGTLAADLTVPAGQAIALQITTAQAGVNFRIDFDSQTKPSKIDLPVSTFIDITALDVYSAAYPGGIPVISGIGGTTKYIRATVTDPFGFSDITGMNITITPGGTVAATSVATAGCTRTYEYVWSTPVSSGTYGIGAVAREGYENTVTHTRNLNYTVCATCAPVAINDSATGAGGSPIVVDALANDYDPNGNLNNNSLTIAVQPKNGSAYISNNTIVYLPNGTFAGKDTLTYQICDLSSPVPLCATAQIFFTIDPLVVDICADAGKTHTYYIPYPEDQSFTALLASSNTTMPSNTIRTVISLKIPYPGMTIVWDEWEDGYETNIANPTQTTTKVWGDGNPFNGIAPGYGSDIIPAGGSIILDNTMNANPRDPSVFFYDGKDKVVSNGQIAMTQVSGEPTRMPVQAIKTNITSTYDFGQSFTVPLGEDFNSRDFRYTALFIRAAEDNTTINIDKDNNGTFETTTTLNQGGSYLVNGGVLTGATVASDKPVGLELNAGGVDQFSIRNAPIFPATWYSNVYYTPVPTSDNPGDSPKDTSVVMLYNSLNRSLTINWYSGAPANGTVTIPAKQAIRFPLAYSTTAAYKFVNLTGESFTAIEIVDSYTPGTGTNDGSTYDWSFNLISEARLTDYTTVAWAPGGLDLVAPAGPDVNGNPIWVTPTANTIVYVKYDGNITGSTGLVSPCGLRYDVSYNLNALNYIKIRDLADNDQSGIAIYTCNGAKIAAVYGEDPQGSSTGIGIAYWDVGATIQPFCKQKLIIATDDYSTTLVNQPVTISVLNNDFGFLATINPSSVSTLGLLQPQNGTVSVNPDGTILYIPNAGFAGIDTFEYTVCSTPSPIVCDIALVIVNISTCPSNGNQNVISGQIFIDRNKDALNNDGALGLAGVKVYLYTDGNCSGTINANELTDSVTVDSSGFYQFVKYPEKTVEDNFQDASGNRTCANGSDGDSPWSTDWTDSNDLSTGFCNTSQIDLNTDVEIMNDSTFGPAIRLKDNDVYARRSVNLSGAIKAFLTFSYRRKSATLTAGEDILVQASSNGVSWFTIYTIAGNGTTDANYVTVYNQDISTLAAANSSIRFMTNTNVDDADTVYIDNVSVRYLKYPQCYITSVDTTTLPDDFVATTVIQKTVTISAGGTCTSEFDFGFGKPNLTVSGTLRNDNNGLIDSQVNGAPTGSPGGSTIHAYLSDASGKVALKTTVNSSNGTYSFAMAEVNTVYTLVLSTTNVALGANAPTAIGCPSTWAAVGDSYGQFNAAGSGVESGAPNTAIAVTTAYTNVINVDIGIQRLPNSDDHIRSINQPTVDQYITMNGAGMNPPVLSGSDPEDCSSGCNLNSRRVIIDTVPNNAELYYNGFLVSNGQTIANFDANLFQMRMTAATLGSTSVSFRYSFVDAALMKDPTPATYALMWFIPLPVDGFTAVANLEGSVATVKWSTLTEQNTDYFVVERSLDNINFAVTGVRVEAAENSMTKQNYQQQDLISGLTQNKIIYYRVKLYDIDGRFKYSNVVTVRLNNEIGITAWPNPFVSTITVNISASQNTELAIRLTDMAGRTIMINNQKASRGHTQVTLNGLEKLTKGIYLLDISDKISGNRTVHKLIKE